MPDPNPLKLFVSYAHADGAKLAQDLVRDLAACGLEPWLDNQRLYGGAIWTNEIEKALDEAEGGSRAPHARIGRIGHLPGGLSATVSVSSLCWRKRAQTFRCIWKQSMKFTARLRRTGRNSKHCSKASQRATTFF